MAMPSPQIVYPDTSRTQSILQLVAMLQQAIGGMGQSFQQAKRTGLMEEEGARAQATHDLAMGERRRQQDSLKLATALFGETTQPELEFQPGGPGATITEPSSQDKLKAWADALAQHPEAAGTAEAKGLLEALTAAGGMTEAQRMRYEAQMAGQALRGQKETRISEKERLARLSKEANAKFGAEMFGLSMKQGLNPQQFLDEANKLRAEAFSASGVIQSEASSKAFQGAMERFEGQATDQAEALLREGMTQVPDIEKSDELLKLSVSSPNVGVRRAAVKLLTEEAITKQKAKPLMYVVVGALMDYYQLKATTGKETEAIPDVGTGVGSLKEDLDRQGTLAQKRQWIYNVLMKSWASEFVVGTDGRRVFNFYQTNFKAAGDDILFKAIDLAVAHMGQVQ